MNTKTKALVEKNGFQVEETGGGCQWLRKGQIVIVGEDANVPEAREACTVYTLDKEGNVDELIPSQEFPSLEAALASLNAPAYQRLSPEDTERAFRREQYQEAMRHAAV